MAMGDWKLLELAEDDRKLTLEEHCTSRHLGRLCLDIPSDCMATVRHVECMWDKILIAAQPIDRSRLTMNV
jgi:hypothetical protein